MPVRIRRQADAAEGDETDKPTAAARTTVMESKASKESKR
jgi:hypothetical protein